MMTKRTLKITISLGYILLLALSGFAAERFSGKVVGMRDGGLLVKDKDGRVLVFDLGLTTKYSPDRKPKTGENVRVEYESKKSFFSKKTVLAAKKIAIFAPQADTALSGEVTVGESGANIRSGPGSAYPVVAVASAGETLVLQGESEGWFRVAVPEKKLVTGWVYSSLVFIDSKIDCSKSDCPQALPATAPHLFLPAGKPQSF